MATAVSSTAIAIQCKEEEGYYRLRVGEVRVIFKIDKVTRTIIVEKISYGERAYE